MTMNNEKLDKEELQQRFADIYGDSHETHVFFSPGRVNLIGEHTDYNGGHVFPCALTIGTYLVIRKRADDKIRCYSLNFADDGVIQCSINQVKHLKEHGWANYVKGVVWALEQNGAKAPFGFDLLVYGNIPNGSGLSSSASLEVGVAYALITLYRRELSAWNGVTNPYEQNLSEKDRVEIAKLCQFAENQFNGVNCGIMDQFAVAMGKKEHAMFLDTATLSYRYVPVHLENVSVIITCSNKKRGLGESKYNERRAECEQALEEIKLGLKEEPSLLSKKYDSVQSFGDLTEEELECVVHLIGSEVRQRRARHAVYENRRTIRAVDALVGDDIQLFGTLMNDSHASLKNDYEVTGKELDTLVETAWTCDGVIGSRMTGAGFGGCTVSLVQSDAVDEFINKSGCIYEEQIGYAADFYEVQIGDGVYEM